MCDNESCARCQKTNGHILICSCCSVGFHPTCVKEEENENSSSEVNDAVISGKKEEAKEKKEEEEEKTKEEMEVGEEEWICPDCRKQSSEQFGYREWNHYTLEQFKKSADMYRENYFVNKEVKY